MLIAMSYADDKKKIIEKVLASRGAQGGLGMVASPVKVNEDILSKYSRGLGDNRLKIKKRLPVFEEDGDDFLYKKYRLSKEEFKKICSTIKSREFGQIAYHVYHGATVDNRPIAEKVSDPFVMFLNQIISKIDNGSFDGQGLIDDMSQILLLKMDKEELDKKNMDVKLAIFKIVLQRIKHDILGTDKPVEANIKESDKAKFFVS